MCKTFFCGQIMFFNVLDFHFCTVSEDEVPFINDIML